MDREEIFVSIKEFARKLGKHPNTIRRAIQNGRIQAVRIGNSKNASFRIPLSEINRVAMFDLENIIEGIIQRRKQSS